MKNVFLVPAVLILFSSLSFADSLSSEVSLDSEKPGYTLAQEDGEESEESGEGSGDEESDESEEESSDN